jgi:hypothetical protein
MPVKKKKVTAKATARAKATAKATGNIVKINIGQQKPKPVRKPAQAKKGGVPSYTIINQVSQLPVPQTYQPQLLGTNNLKSAQLSGNLGVIRNNEINNGSSIEIGGNQDRRILSSADILAEQMNPSIRQPSNLLARFEAEDYEQPISTTSSSSQPRGPGRPAESTLLSPTVLVGPSLLNLGPKPKLPKMKDL